MEDIIKSQIYLMLLYLLFITFPNKMKSSDVVIQLIENVDSHKHQKKYDDLPLTVECFIRNKNIIIIIKKKI